MTQYGMLAQFRASIFILRAISRGFRDMLTEAVSLLLMSPSCSYRFYPRFFAS